MANTPITLAIDTSCDETSCSVVDGIMVLSNVLPSQIEFHRKYGGVVPSIAKLAHQDRIDNVVKESIRKAKISMNKIDSISVTMGPGLAIALEVGIKKAKEIAQQYNKPIIAINHMEGHLLSCFARPNSKRNENMEILNSVQFPVLGILISGGHTEFVLVNHWGKYEVVGKTLDDACGEAFDKCGRILGLGYPAGPVITKFSKIHYKNVEITKFRKHKSLILKLTNRKTKDSYELPVPMATSGDLNMSFSGLKTAFLNLVCDISGENITNLNPNTSLSSKLSKIQILDLCVMLEASVLEQLSIKLEKAIEIYKPKEVWVGGGVISSARVRSRIRSLSRKNNIIFRQPYSQKLTTDNAAMIGVAGNVRLVKLFRNLKHDPSNGVFIKDFDELDRSPRLVL
jgi:N6-L-threonylcarbamoyladenine synthase